MKQSRRRASPAWIKQHFALLLLNKDLLWPQSVHFYPPLRAANVQLPFFELFFQKACVDFLVWKWTAFHFVSRFSPLGAAKRNTAKKHIPESNQVWWKSVLSSQVSFIYKAQYHILRVASGGFTIWKAYNTLCPQTVNLDWQSNQEISLIGKKRF